MEITRVKHEESNTRIISSEKSGKTKSFSEEEILKQSLTSVRAYHCHTPEIANDQTK